MSASLIIPPIATVTADGSTNVYTLAIPAGSYVHLTVYAEVAGTTGIGLLQVRFNGDSGTNYSTEGTGSRDGQTSLFWGVVAAANSGPASVFISDIPLFASTTFYKYTETRSLRNDSLKFASAAVGGRWQSTAAITSITFTLGAGGNFAAGSRIDVYAVGGSIPLDGTTIVSTGGVLAVSSGFVQAGSIGLTIPAGSASATGVVTFLIPYTTAPIVVVSGVDGTYICAAQSVTATTFTAKIETAAPLGAPTTYTLNWHAVPATPSIGGSMTGTGTTYFASGSMEGSAGTPFTSQSMNGSGS